MPVEVIRPCQFLSAYRSIAMSMRPKCENVFAAHANPATSQIPMPGSPSGVRPVNTVEPAMLTKSWKLLIVV